MPLTCDRLALIDSSILEGVARSYQLQISHVGHGASKVTTHVTNTMATIFFVNMALLR